MLLSPPNALSALVKQFWSDGWQAVGFRDISCDTIPPNNCVQNIHCIGDRANKVVLDILEDIIEGDGSGNLTDWRPRIEHAQIMQASDLERAGRLGGSFLLWMATTFETELFNQCAVITSVQPTHACVTDVMCISIMNNTGKPFQDQRYVVC
jgi:predicted amidohydrolase YtcJ